MNYVNLSTFCQPTSLFKTWSTLVSADASASILEDVFQQTPALPGVIVLGAGAEVTLLSRKVFLASLSRPFGREVFLKRPIWELLESSRPETLSLEAHTPLSLACRAALARSHSTRFEPILVTGGESMFIMELADLLLAQADALERIVAEKDALVEQTARAAIDLEGALREQHLLAEELQRARQLAEYDAKHDSLTGLLNRKGFVVEMEAALKTASSRKDTDYWLLFLDLDRFKLINDSLGHHLGNELLVQVAQRLSSFTSVSGNAPSVSGIAGRHSGDEFVLLCVAPADASAIWRTTKTLYESLTSPYLLDGKHYAIDVSIGMVPSLSAYQSYEPALRDADIAMYEAKRNPNRKIVLFEHTMYQALQKRMSLETELRGAVGRGELVLHYQPIIETKSGNIFAYEALIRWNRPDGMMMPGQFIGMAEETGLINEIGLWVMRESCYCLKEMNADVDPYKFRMSLNISARQLANGALPELLEKVCIEAGVPTSCFILEITERTAMENPEHSSIVLGDLKRRGFSLALDDFGTGHSSLSWLHKYPFDILKLDRSLTAEVGLTPNSNKMAAGILCLSKFMGLTVIAEGVERPSQKDELYFLGFRLMQGYHFGYPLPTWQTEVTREEKMLTV